MRYVFAKRTTAFYLSAAAGVLYLASIVIGLSEHGVDEKAGGTILGGLVFTVLAMGKRQH